MIRTFLDAFAVLRARPGRMISQGTGMALGSALFVLALGLGQTIVAQVDDRFDSIKATTVTVDAAAEGAPPRVSDLADFVTPERRDSAHRVGGLESISRLGIVRDVDLEATPLSPVTATSSTKANLIAADSSLFGTAGARVDGFGLSPVDDVVSRRVAVIGKGLAATLGVDRPGGQLKVGSTYLTIIGIIRDTDRLPDLLSSAVVGLPVAKSIDTQLRMEPRLIVRTKAGAGVIVASALALQLRPDAPETLQVTAAQDPDELHQKVSSDVELLSVGAAIVVLAAGVFAVANLMLLSIAQRTPEIGMRRALGASSAQVVGMVLAEAVSVGVVAGVLGTLIGMWTLLGICIANHWAPVVSLTVIWIGVAAGVLGGAIGGAVPAITAARVQPAEALRR